MNNKPRKPLTRRTPLPRSTKPMARSPIKPVSKRKQKLDHEQKPMLDEFRKLFPRCQFCGRRKGTDIHEILAGSFRERARAHRSCILHLCRLCHGALQGADRTLQLAVKFKADPLGFDLLRVNEILGSPTAVTMAEIDAELQKFDPFA